MKVSRNSGIEKYSNWNEFCHAEEKKSVNLKTGQLKLSIGIEGKKKEKWSDSIIPNRFHQVYQHMHA